MNLLILLVFILIFALGIFSLYLQRRYSNSIKHNNSLTMYNCFDIADYFLKKAKDEGQVLDPMKLLKLTYIAHGYNLGFFDKPLFSNKIQAWMYGTVIPDLYHVIKRFRSGPVDESIMELYSEKKIEGEQKKLLDFVWSHYKKLTGLQLSDLTHKEGTPWKTTYNSTYDLEIPNEVIKEYYKQLIKGKSE